MQQQHLINLKRVQATLSYSKLSNLMLKPQVRPHHPLKMNYTSMAKRLFTIPKMTLKNSLGTVMVQLEGQDPLPLGLHVGPHLGSWSLGASHPGSAQLPGVYAHTLVLH